MALEPLHRPGSVNSSALIAGHFPTEGGVFWRFTSEGALIGLRILDRGTLGDVVRRQLRVQPTAAMEMWLPTRRRSTLANGSVRADYRSEYHGVCCWNDGGPQFSSYALRSSTVNAPDSFIDLDAVMRIPRSGRTPDC